jgi:hypothetical protein
MLNRSFITWLGFLFTFVVGAHATDAWFFEKSCRRTCEAGAGFRTKCDCAREGILVRHPIWLQATIDLADLFKGARESGRRLELAVYVILGVTLMQLFYVVFSGSRKEITFSFKRSSQRNRGLSPAGSLGAIPGFSNHLRHWRSSTSSTRSLTCRFYPQVAAQSAASHL